MLSVSAACQDFPKPFPNNRRSRGVGGVKKEICNYLLRPLLLTNVHLRKFKKLANFNFF
jgi:hypothetical protein